MSDSLQHHGLLSPCQAPLSTVILQARILEWDPCPPPGDLPNPGNELRSPSLQMDSLLSEPPGKPISSLIRDQTHVPCIARRILNHWTTRKVPILSYVVQNTVDVICITNIRHQN